MSTFSPKTLIPIVDIQIGYLKNHKKAITNHSVGPPCYIILVRISLRCRPWYVCPYWRWLTLKLPIDIFDLVKGFEQCLKIMGGWYSKLLEGMVPNYWRGCIPPIPPPGFAPLVLAVSNHYITGCVSIQYTYLTVVENKLRQKSTFRKTAMLCASVRTC